MDLLPVAAAGVAAALCAVVVRQRAPEIALALALAALSWFLVERPALRMKRRWVAAPVATPPAGAPTG